MIFLKPILLIVIFLKHFGNGVLYEPRLDELMKRTSTLAASLGNIRTILRNTEKLLEETQEKQNPSKTITGSIVHHVSVGSGGTIYSPALENILPATHASCTWELHAPPGHSIHLNFTYFNLAYGQTSEKYIYNKLQIQTKISEMEQVVEAVLWESPHEVHSHGSTMVLHFEANQLFNGIGFVAEYWPECRSILVASAEESTSLFSHPLFGYEDYPPNIDCEWLINPSNTYNEQVVFTWNDIHVGSRNLSEELDTTEDKALQKGLEESYCQNDFVEIYTIGHSKAERPHLQGRICGDSIPSEVTSVTGYKILVRFYSGDTAVKSSGFSATYKSEKEEYDYKY